MAYLYSDLIKGMNSLMEKLHDCTPVNLLVILRISANTHPLTIQSTHGYEDVT